MFTKIRKYWSWKRIYNNLKFLIKFDLLDEWFRLKDETIEDCAYELDELRERLPHLNVLEEEDTINLLMNEPKSFARYGDGEVDIMKGRDVPFQDFNDELARKMKQQLIEKRDDLYVGLNSSYFHTATKYSKRNHRYYRIYGTELRRYFNDICDQSNTYLDACCFGGYFRQAEDFDIEAHFKKVKQLFKGKNIAIVCGKGILDSLDYDLFELCDNRIVVDAPKKNAFMEYDTIIKDITLKVPKDYLVCIILGMTATVLAGDLAKLGYIAWDIGHAAKDYDAYRKKVEKTDDNIDNFFAPD